MGRKKKSEEVLAETTDPLVMEAQFEERFATDEWYRHLYRTSYAYHGVHPFYMWYWGAHAMQHLGQVIIVGGDAKAPRIDFAAALGMALTSAIPLFAAARGRVPLRCA